MNEFVRVEMSWEMTWGRNDHLTYIEAGEQMIYELSMIYKRLGDLWVIESVRIDDMGDEVKYR